jgi:hypothetical protein
LAIRKFQHVELDLRLLQRGEVTIQDGLEALLSIDWDEAYYVPDHLGSGRHDFAIEHKNGYYQASLYLLIHALNPYSLLYLYLQRSARGNYERNDLA